MSHKLSNAWDLVFCRVKRESKLLPFFQTFSQYAQMDYDRRSLMDKLAKRFPKLIKSNHALRKLLVDGTVLPGGSGVQSLTFRSARYVIFLTDMFQDTFQGRYRLLINRAL